MIIVPETVICQVIESRLIFRNEILLLLDWPKMEDIRGFDIYTPYPAHLEILRSLEFQEEVTVTKVEEQLLGIIARNSYIWLDPM